MDVFKLCNEERPEWHQRAACRGMTDAFWDASHDEQKQVCDGTVAPWAKPCPVREECLEAFVSACLTLTSTQEAEYNSIVHGGYAPDELLTIVRSVKRDLKERKKNESSVRASDLPTGD